MLKPLNDREIAYGDLDPDVGLPPLPQHFQAVTAYTLSDMLISMGNGETPLEEIVAVLDEYTHTQ